MSERADQCNEATRRRENMEALRRIQLQLTVLAPPLAVHATAHYQLAGPKSCLSFQFLLEKSPMFDFFPSRDKFHEEKDGLTGLCRAGGRYCGSGENRIEGGSTTKGNISNPTTCFQDTSQYIRTVGLCHATEQSSGDLDHKITLCYLSTPGQDCHAAPNFCIWVLTRFLSPCVK